MKLNDMVGKRIITIGFNPRNGYPAGKDMYFHCLICDEVIDSFPKVSIMCECRNISIDVDYGRVAVYKGDDTIELLKID